MTDIERMKKRKKELGMTNQQLSERSGVPVGTVNKIFSGATKSPQYDTMVALETALGMYLYQDEDGRVDGIYTVDDYDSLPDHVRAELIDGDFYYVAAPGRIHQELLGELHYYMKDHIRKHDEACKVYLAPFDVRLDRDDKTMVQPDLMVVCRPESLTDRGMDGAPDLIMEIVSSGSRKLDYQLKMRKYWNAGVREYWIIDPLKERIVVYLFDGDDMDMSIFGTRDQIPVGIFEDLVIDFGKIHNS